MDFSDIALATSGLSLGMSIWSLCKSIKLSREMGEDKFIERLSNIKARIERISEERDAG